MDRIDQIEQLRHSLSDAIAQDRDELAAEIRAEIARLAIAEREAILDLYRA